MKREASTSILPIMGVLTLSTVISVTFGLHRNKAISSDYSVLPSGALILRYNPFLVQESLHSNYKSSLPMGTLGTKMLPSKSMVEHTSVLFCQTYNLASIFLKMCPLVVSEIGILVPIKHFSIVIKGSITMHKHTKSYIGISQ